YLFQKRNWGPMADSETYAHLEHLRIIGPQLRFWNRYSEYCGTRDGFPRFRPMSTTLSRRSSWWRS
ncbi:MAG: hypothetical protein AAGK32_11045, partial [Actinomycetota bacterium]